MIMPVWSPIDYIYKQEGPGHPCLQVHGSICDVQSLALRQRLAQHCPTGHHHVALQRMQQAREKQGNAVSRQGKGPQRGPESQSGMQAGKVADKHPSLLESISRLYNTPLPLLYDIRAAPGFVAVPRHP